MTGGRAVDIAARPKNLVTPLFTGEVRQNPRFDGVEVTDDELVSRLRDEGRPDQLGQHLRHGIVQQGQGIVVALPDELPRLLQIGHGVPVEVLQLDQPPGPATGPVRAIELEHPVAAAIGADRVLHRLVFLDAALGELEPQAEDLTHFLRG